MRPLNLGGRGGQFIDLNLLPPALRPRDFPMLGVVLGLIAAAAVLLLLGLYQFKASADDEVGQLAAELRVQQDRYAASVANGDIPAGSAEVNKYRIGWSRVLQTIVASLPADIRLSDVSFAADLSRGPMATIKGDASEYAAIVEYADNLRSSPFFSRVSIQSMGLVTTTLPAGNSTPAATTPGRAAMTPTATRAPAGATAPARIPPTPQLIQPTATPVPNRAPVRPSSTPTVEGPLVITPTIIAPGGTPTRTVPAGQATATRTPAASPTPTAANYDFIVSSRVSTCDVGRPNDYAGDLISGHVYDLDGMPLAGIRVRVASIYTASPWSAETTTDGDGFYRFYLTKYNYKVEVTSGSSQVANELWTRSQGEPGACFWQVDFKKNNAATPVPAPEGTVTVTPTPTRTGSATPTPTRTPTAISGTVITGTATASLNETTAWLAVDGNVDTIWTSGDAAPQDWTESFSETVTLRGIALVVTQAPAGSTTHVVHFLDASDVELSSLTITGNTSEGETIQRTFATPIAGVQKLRIETTVSPSWVAWREIRAYVGPSPTATPTPTPTPMMEPDDTPALAQPIPLDGSTQVRTFYKSDDVDWGVFYNANPLTVTTYIRALGASGVRPEIRLFEGVDQYRGIATSGGPCGGSSDTLLTFDTQGSTTYYARFNSYLNTTGMYTITANTSAPACGGALGSISYGTSIAGSDTEAEWPRPPGLAAPQQPAEETPPGAKQPTSFVILLDIRQEGSP